jgi:hypothetical protein
VGSTLLFIVSRLVSRNRGRWEGGFRMGKLTEDFSLGHCGLFLCRGWIQVFATERVAMQRKYESLCCVQFTMMMSRTMSLVVDVPKAIFGGMTDLGDKVAKRGVAFSASMSRV